MPPSTEASAAHRRWRRPVRRVCALALTAAVVTLIWGWFGPERRIVVSRETTFITEPLKPDGLPDYDARMLDDMGRATPAEENAAVAVLHARWPMGLDTASCEALCVALGIPASPPEMKPLVWVEDDSEVKTALTRMLSAGKASPDVAPYVLNALGIVRTKPWRADDWPPCAAWVARQSPTLDLLVAASSKPRFWLPDIALLVDRSADTTTGLEKLSALRTVCQTLVARSMLSIGEGRPGDAWTDIRAVHRLARLLVPPGRSDHSHMHMSSDMQLTDATRATLTLLGADRLTADDAARIGRDLDALPPRADPVSSLAPARLYLLRGLCMLPTMNGRERAAASGDSPHQHQPGLWWARLDLNTMLEEANAAYDRIEEAARRPDYDRALVAIDEEGWASAERDAGWRRITRTMSLVTSRRARSKFLVSPCFNSLGAATLHRIEERRRSNAEIVLLRLAAALAEYRARGLGGAERPYPDRLDALVPDVLSTVPADPITGGALHYERCDDGYVLYSVGINKIDDGGVDDEGMITASGISADDVVVRMPSP